MHSGHARSELLRHQRLPRDARADLSGELRVQGAELGEALNAVVEAVRGRDRLDGPRDTGERVRVLAAGGDEAAVLDEDVGWDTACRVDGGDLGKKEEGILKS